MADIKNYLKEKEKREQNQVNYRKKIKKHKITIVYRTLLIITVVIAVIALVVIQYNRRIFSGYDEVASIPREKSANATDLRFHNAILTYSKDGAHCTDAKGNITWNQTYEIQDIKLAMCQDVVAIADYNGRDIYVQSTDKQIGQIKTTMPIKDITVSATGYVTAVLQDTDFTWVNTYNEKGEMIYKGQTQMQETGYPCGMSLSPNGELLAVSYVYMDAGELKTNVVFYNFGPVGANQTDFMESVYIYTDTLIPEIHFMDNNTVFAVGDNGLMIYKGSQKPVLEATYLSNQEIKSVCYNEKNIGIVFLSNDGENDYKLEVYDTAGKKVGSYNFDLDYRHLFFGTDYFAVYNETECMIMTFQGVEKFNGTFSKSITMMLPLGTAYRYLLITEDSIDTIQLK